jgi:uncharacterized protein YceH (UPF0502 family)
MKSVLAALALMALVPANATETAKPATDTARLQAQIDALRQQVLALQKQVNQPSHSSVCISLRCA